MKTKVQKWGNSLALRIPKAFAKELHLVPDSLVELSFEDGRLVLVPVESNSNQFELDALLAEINEDNMHTEVAVGDAVGQEVW